MQISLSFMLQRSLPNLNSANHKIFTNLLMMAFRNEYQKSKLLIFEWLRMWSANLDTLYTAGPDVGLSVVDLPARF